MKKLFPLLMLAVVLTAFSSDQSICFKYFPSKEGSVYEISNYNAKDKLVSKVENKIVSSTKTAGGYTVTVESRNSNPKEEVISSGTYTAKCENDTFYLDMQNMIPAEMTKAYANAEMEITGGLMEFPSNPAAGDHLPDAEINMNMISSGVSLINIYMSVTDRKVEGFEKITTPAGTFDCIKLSQTTYIKALLKSTYKTTTWMAENVGMVRTESYDDNGNVKSYSVLTKYN